MIFLIYSSQSLAVTKRFLEKLFQRSAKIILSKRYKIMLEVGSAYYFEQKTFRKLEAVFTLRIECINHALILSRSKKLKLSKLPNLYLCSADIETMIFKLGIFPSFRLVYLAFPEKLSLPVECDYSWSPRSVENRSYIKKNMLFFS